MEVGGVAGRTCSRALVTFPSVVQKYASIDYRLRKGPRIRKYPGTATGGAGTPRGRTSSHGVALSLSPKEPPNRSLSPARRIDFLSPAALDPENRPARSAVRLDATNSASACTLTTTLPTSLHREPSSPLRSSLLLSAPFRAFPRRSPRCLALCGPSARPPPTPRPSSRSPTLSAAQPPAN